MDKGRLEREVEELAGVAAARLRQRADGSVECCEVVPSDEAPLAQRWAAAGADPDQLWLLPGGAPCYGLNGHELAYMAWEQGTEDAYRLGALTRPDAVVIDAGANIGLFSVLAAARAPQARVVAIEPVPAVHDVLLRNLRLHGVGAQVHAHQRALGATAETTTFTFAPFFAALSSRHLTERADICRRLVLAIRVLLPSIARDSELDLAQAKEWMTGQLQERQVEVEVMPLSQLIEEEGLERIDLLKVDVEGSELAVLDGIAEAHWPRIERVAIEVNDVDGRIASVHALLERKGFHVATEDDPSASRVVPHRIGIVHASRTPLPPRSSDAPLPALATEAQMGAEVDRLVATVSAHLGGGPEAEVRVLPVLGATPTSRGEDDAFVEAVTGHLATLLGVPPLARSQAWRQAGAAHA